MYLLSRLPANKLWRQKQSLKRKSNKMENNEFPIDESIEQIQPTEYIPDIDDEDVLWDEELDQYLNYIDNVYQTNSQPLEELEPYVDTSIYRQTEMKSNRQGRKRQHSPKKHSVVLMIAVALLVVLGIGGGWAFCHFTNIFSEKTSQSEKTTEDSGKLAATTEEASTEEDKYGPYATTDYTVHTPHATENTIVFDSNPYSLRYGTPASKKSSSDEPEKELTLEDIYPAITLTPVEGSLNATQPDTANPVETQQITSKYMVLIDLSDDSIVAKRDSDVVINPASMTKILTVLTATDMIKDLDDTYVITQEEIQYAYAHDCSAVGFLEGETVTVRDLVYGTIVCSGADAAIGLANYCCGSQEAFVEKMNEKVEALELSDTAHFTNVVGIYDENLHCTMEDMAVILSTAIQNDLCRDVLSTRIYTTTPDPSLLPDKAKVKSTETGTDEAAGKAGTDDGQTLNTETGETTEEEIPESLILVATKGIEISNWFMRRIEDKQTGGEVLGAKTGYVSTAGSCAASYYKSASGKEYVCVTGDTYSSWRCIYDHVGIYRSLAR